MEQSRIKKNSQSKSDLIWILDDEWPSHYFTCKLLQEQGYEPIVTRSVSYKEDYPKYAARARGILLSCLFPLEPADIRGLTSCKIITVFCGGFDNLDIAVTTQQGIIATYVPGYCVEEVSSHVLSLLLALNRRLSDCQNMTRKGDWQPIEIGPIRRLKGQVLGIVGFGRIGRAVAEKAKCLGLEVKVFDPYMPQIDEPGIQAASFDEVVSSADYLSLHVPLTENTHHLISAKVFSAMKGTAYLINACRGKVVDEAALIEALNSKKIAGAGLDVLDKEPPDPQNPLLSMPNVIITPHSAYVSEDATRELMVKAVKAVTAALEGNRPEDIINPEVLERQTR